MQTVENTGMDKMYQRLILDMPRTPITGRETFEAPIFVDASGEIRTLLDLCPHLQLIYGEISASRSEETLATVEKRLREEAGDEFDHLIQPFLELPGRDLVTEALGEKFVREFGRYLWGTVKLYEDYENRISTIRLAVPAEFLKTCVEDIWREVQRRDAGEALETSVFNIFARRLKPIIDFVIDEFQLHDEAKIQRLRARFESESIRMLGQLMKQWPQPD
jgi:hypothetical protein